SRRLGLRGPLAGDSTAQTLHVLLLAVLAWSISHAAIFLPRFVARPSAGALLLTYLATTAITALALLRFGLLRPAAIVYLGGTGLVSTVLIGLSGGTMSPALVL